MNKKRMTLSIVWIVIGVILLILSLTETINQSVWAGMGGGLVGVGLVQLFRNIKYGTNQEYREKIDTQNSDERNKFLSNKAWAWAGYCYVMIAAAATIILLIVGRPEYILTAGSICLMLVLYWLCYVLLGRKY